MYHTKISAEVLLEHFANGMRDFGGSVISESGRNLRNKNLSGIILSRSFIEADFSHTDLRGADLSNSNLKCCDFSNADLRSANFAGSAIDGTVFKNAQLDKGALKRAIFQGEEVGDWEPDDRNT